MEERTSPCEPINDGGLGYDGLDTGAYLDQALELPAASRDPWLHELAGMPIDRYCDEQRLSIDERVKLFMKVADAVHYAHRHLIVHAASIELVDQPEIKVHLLNVIGDVYVQHDLADGASAQWFESELAAFERMIRSQ